MEEAQDDVKVSSSTYWKALAHPLRCGILSLLASREMTNEEMAKSLGVESGALYYHTQHLVSAQMIEHAGTRQKGPMTEKLYRGVSRQYLAPPVDSSSGVAPFYDVMASALELYRTSWEEEREHVQRLQFGYQVVVVVPRDTVAEVVAQLKAILERLKDENGSDPGGVPIALATLMHSVTPGVFGRNRRKKEVK